MSSTDEYRNNDVLKENMDHENIAGESELSTLTNVRNVVSPYLPPPVLDAMSYIDANPNMQSLGDEPSMLILSAVFAIFMIGRGFKFLSFLSSGKAVEGLDNDDESPEGNVLDNLDANSISKTNQETEYSDSVILFGPSYSGKTVLFNTLLSYVDETKEREIPLTVMSLKANISYLQERGGEVENKNVRIVDYPGHITLSSKLPLLLQPPSKSNQTVRALLVIDSTKVVSEAASLLYDTILTNKNLLEAWEKEGEVLNIMVLCNKMDATNAKNWRRVKIQLRTELEKLKKISSGVSSSSGSGLEGISEEKRPLSGKSIDFDDLTKNGLSNISISFSSCSCINGDGIDAVSAFVTGGHVVTDNSSILTQRKDKSVKKQSNVI